MSKIISAPLFRVQLLIIMKPGSYDVVGDLSLQNTVVTSLNHHEGGRYILTCSSASGALWDLQTFHRKRMLSGASVAGLKEVLFFPILHDRG